MKAALIGNPNCGKSTLFNALTGSRQKVGNWPGVTVEQKSGHFEGTAQQRIEIIDLPGVYSLVATTEDTAVDTRIAREAITKGEMDLIINILDASNLERHLYLTMQLLEMQLPMLVVVNMLDVLESRGMQLDCAQLAQRLGCPVIGLSALKKTAVQGLKKAILANPAASVSPLVYPVGLQNTVVAIRQALPSASPFLALSWLEGSTADLPPEQATFVQAQRQKLEAEGGEDADILIADARYTAAHAIAAEVLAKTTEVPTKTGTQQIDSLVLHRLWGIPIFLASIYCMFFFSINIGQAFQPFFDQVSNAIFVDGFAQLLNALHTPPALVALLTLGVGKGINTVVTFIPILGCLFLWLSFLESTGYMARAAFVVDRVMRMMGLPGKSFVPLIVGFGCNVPAILAARTLENRRDRLLTLMMTPFMSCGARLAIYAVFTAAFFHHGGQNVVFMLYMIGILMAVMTGFVLRKTVLKGASSPWLVELPTYHIPRPAVLLRATWHRLKAFVVNAGRYIIPVCLLVGGLNAFTVQGDLVSQAGKGNMDSALSVVGRAITPVFAPMGIQQDNWPATVGLVSGVLAKEVVVGTLNTLYAQAAQLPLTEEASDFHFMQAMQAALLSIPEGLAALKNSFSNPIAASSSDATMDSGVLGTLVHYFDGQVGAMAYLLFVLLYFPCISATAALARESSRNWALFSVLWTTGLAYVVAVIFYQAATWARHPASSAYWVLGLCMCLAGVLWGIQYYARETSGTLSTLSDAHPPI
jgi:ferrous iron transport protein B